MLNIKMDMIQTVGLAVIILILGRVLRNKVKFFETYCIPSPVVGGFLFAIINLILRKSNLVIFEFDNTLQSFFMTLFFTSIGFNASWRLLKVGGKKVGMFLIMAIVLVILQNIVAVGVGYLTGVDPLIALLTGSTAMTGGHGTAAAMAPIVEELGHTGAKSVAIAAATFGLIAGSSLGGPLANRLIKGKKLEVVAERVDNEKVRNDEFLFNNDVRKLDGENFAKAFFLILLSMFIGSYVSTFLNQFLNFPNYIGPMIVAAILRNISDHTTKFDLHYEEVHILEDVSLNLFLGMAMISLKLWELSSVAGQLAVLLLAQALLAWVFIYFVTFRFMGRNYDAAVLSAGHVGFGLGATPNGIANMQSVCDKYKHSHIAFFVMPIVGALFIDFFNVAIISGFFSFLSR
ncbi:sodium/glutamate symporter [uncultured Gemella sp.]|uniref:sodium/glutamate symporter n=1 Tax=uncultured Gemella sp. TaxID=254352 RepID=UPI002601A8A7|nr:sodium/glutamate symporter [uncultured Gemella sp.]